MNINSVSKIAALEAFAQTLNTTPLVVALVEVRAQVLPPFLDYTSYLLPRTRDTGGGLAYYVHPSLPVQELFQESRMLPEIELFAIKIYDLKIYLVYRPPAANKNRFLEIIDEVLLLGGSRVICVGDFNIDLNVQSVVAVSLQASFLQAGYSQKVNVPTRVTVLSQTLIDHCYVKSLNVTVRVSTGAISDHHPLVVTIQEVVQSKRVEIGHFYRYSSENYEKFIHVFQAELLKGDFPDLFDDYLRLFTDIHEQVFGELRSRNYAKRMMVPWMTRALCKRIKKRKRLYCKYLQTKTTEDFIRFKFYRNKLIADLREARQNHIYAKLNYQTDVKKQWAEINRQTARNLKPRNVVLKDPQGNLLSAKESADLYSEAFADIPRIIPRIDQISIHPSVEQFRLTEVDPKDVLKVIQGFESKPSKDPDNLTVLFLKTIAHHIVHDLAYFINQSFRSGKFPECLKRAIVHPIFKAGDKNDPTNYRPILILSVFSKVYEKCYYEQYRYFLESRNLLSYEQFGFCRQRSTSDALVSLAEVIKQRLDKNGKVLALFVDFRKAFDVIPHAVLIAKLGNFGLEGSPRAWLVSYLSNRKQAVVVDQARSSFVPVLSGVPQGSLLGPLLFILAINDLPSALRPAPSILYADDMVTYVEGRDEVQMARMLQDVVAVLEGWCQINGFLVNSDKSKILTFHAYQNPLMENPPQVTMVGRFVERVNTFRYLGVVFDSSLSWQSQINAVLLRTTRALGVIRANRTLFSPKVKTLLVHTLVASNLEYGVIVWGQGKDSKFARISRLLKRVARLTLVTPRLRLVFSPRYFAWYQVGLLLYRHEKHWALRCLILRRRILYHAVHSRDRYVVPTIGTNYGFNALKYRAPWLYNLFPDEVRLATRYLDYKMRLQTFISTIVEQVFGS